jgi:subtilase family serine protease
MPTAEPGHARSFIWLSGAVAPLDTQDPQPNALPTICTASGQLYGLYCPNNLQTTYGTASIPSANGGAGKTIVIVDAFGYTKAENDLGVYSSTFGLPACTVVSGCLTIVNQNGLTTPLPGNPTGSNQGWELETMLDLEAAHSMAPNAHLVLVQATNNSNTNLYKAVVTGTGMGDIVTDSWGGGEFAGETTEDSTFASNNKPVLFSSGDNGAPAQYPCASPNVTCVGGTTLNVNSNYVRTTETGWSGSGGGCSEYEPSVSWQNPASAPSILSVAHNCGVRAVPDIAADADPNTGIWVYASLYCGASSVCGVGGTSLASPLMAGIFADIMASRTAFSQPQLDNNLNSVIYAAVLRNYAYFFYDVTSGNNGFAAGTGFDLVTGLGVAKGAGMGNRLFGLIYAGPSL